MPKMTRDQIKEREEFVLGLWKKLWPKGTHTKARDLPTAALVNSELHKRYKEHMRSDKLYGLRDQAVAELRAGGVTVPDPPRKTKKDSGAPVRKSALPVTRPAAPRVPVVSAGRDLGLPAEHGLPVIVRGVDSVGAQAIGRALDQLREVGAANLRVEHQADTYVVINIAN